MIAIPYNPKSWMRHFTFDLVSMRRPERSGVYALLLAYTMLWAWGYGGANFIGSGFSVKCYVMPWECPREEQKSEPVKPRYNRVVMLYPGHSKLARHICTCHLDVRQNGKPADHLFAAGEEQLTCDSEDTQPRDWTGPPKAETCMDDGRCFDVTGIMYLSHAKDGSLQFVEIRPGEGEYRWHCE